MDKTKYTADWQEGIVQYEQKELATDQRRLFRVCGEHLRACLTNAPELSVFEMENRLRAQLARHRKSNGEPLSRAYVTNLIWAFGRIIEASPKREFSTDAATAWREALCRKNELLNRKTSAAIPHFLAFVAKENWTLTPKTIEETSAFKSYLVELGFKTERVNLYPRVVRRLIRDSNLLIEPVKAQFTMPTEVDDLLNRMKAVAVKQKDAAGSGRKTLREHRAQKQLIRVGPRTWKKIERTFRLYLKHQIVIGRYASSDGWETLFDVERVSDYFDHRNADTKTSITAKTGESILSSLSKVMIFLREMGELSLDEKQFAFLKYQLWTLNKDIHENFEKKSNAEREALAGAIPLYESIYPIYLKYVLSAWRKIDSVGLPAPDEALALRGLVLLILSIEFGWRPEDYATTLTVDHISRIERPTQRPFYFFRFIPSKTAWRKPPPVATAPFPPWFDHILTRYLSCLEKLRGDKLLSNRQLIPRLYMLADDPDDRAAVEALIATREIDTYNRTISRMIKIHCERAVGKPLTANVLRKSIASFFQRYTLPGLYMFTGRSASRETELQTQMEVKSYASPGSSNPEALLSVRYGERVRGILKVDEHIQNIQKTILSKELRATFKSKSTDAAI